jgi:hypothetical protein
MHLNKAFIPRLEQCRTCLCVNLLLIRVCLFEGSLLKYVLRMYRHACMCVCVCVCVWARVSSWPTLTKPDQPGPLVTSRRHAAPVYRFPAILYETCAPFVSPRSSVPSLVLQSVLDQSNAALNCAFSCTRTARYSVVYPDRDYVPAPGCQGFPTNCIVIVIFL